MTADGTGVPRPPWYFRRWAGSSPCDRSHPKPPPTPGGVRVAAYLWLVCADLGSIEALLGGLGAFPCDRLDGVRRTRHEGIDVDLGLKLREDVVRHRAPVAATRPADTDPEPQEVLGAQGRGDRAQAVVPGQAAADANLQTTGAEVDVIVDDEQGTGSDLEETGGRPDGLP